jgi:aryl-alcohol dehydrogenase-like predicted oxidoreductase
MERISGFATCEATAAYRDRMIPLCHPLFYRQSQGLWFSSLGMGTYLGTPDAATDDKYRDILSAGILRGCNVLDTALNYRCQHSEKVIGKVIRSLLEQNLCQREELVISSKGGFLSVPQGQEDYLAYFQRIYVNHGLASREDLVMGCHCLAPGFIYSELEQSLENLGLKTLDIYFIHNPETQLESVFPERLYERLYNLFLNMEDWVKAGKIRCYGISTWKGLRVEPEETEYLDLSRILSIAEEAGGPDHHLRALQFPYNMAMTESWLELNQFCQGVPATVFSIAESRGLITYASAPLLQGELIGDMPDHLASVLESLDRPAQKALQFARSVPGLSSCLVGMSHMAHLDENMALAKIPPLSPEEYQTLLGI